MSVVIVALSASFLSQCERNALGQRGGGANATANASASAAPSAAAGQAGGPGAGASSSAGSLQGMSFPRDSWDQVKFLPAPDRYVIKNKSLAAKLDSHFNDRDADAAAHFLDDFAIDNFTKSVVIYCYTMKQNNTASVPFLLVPTQTNQPVNSRDSKPKDLCANQSRSFGNAPSLVMGKYLIFRVDMSEISPAIRDRIQTLNINIASQTGSSLNSQRGPTINPNIVLPSMALLSGEPFSGCKDYEKAGRPPNYFRNMWLGSEPIGDAFCYSKDSKFQNVYYLAWPAPLVGDATPTVNINLIYTPVAPAIQWTADTFYPAGSIVVSNSTDGHYYLALNSGVSTTVIPPLADHVTRLTIFSDLPDSTGLFWQDMGLLPSPDTWTSGKAYALGAQVVPPVSLSTGHYYQATQGGTAGQTPPGFTSNAGQTLPDAQGSTLVWKDMGPLVINPTPVPWAANTAYEVGALVTTGGGSPQTPSNGHYYRATSRGASGVNAPAFPIDGTVVIESDAVKYVDAGTTPPANGKLKAWRGETAYFLGDAILDTTTGRYYTVVQPGISGKGSTPPRFAVPIQDKTPKGPHQFIAWLDLGSTLPASTSVGEQPADQIVSVLNLTYPQVHVLSRFNLTSGVVITSLKPPVISTFAESNSTSATNCPPGLSSCTYYTSAKGARLIDPVLGVTTYIFRPLDAERPFTWKDLTPAPSLYFSLTSPSSNYHVGFASEFFYRNLQIIYGASIVEETRVTGAQATITTTASGSPVTSPVTIAGQLGYLSTTKVTNAGGFIGLSFNITGFIQSLIP
jgi:hypothetical protein